MTPSTVQAVLDRQPTPTRVFYFARYIDWTFTTPLLLVLLGMTEMRYGPKRRPGATGDAVLVGVMIVTAVVFGASLMDWTKWTWFIVSCSAFLGAYYVIWKPHMEANATQHDDVQATYRRYAFILSVVWLIYLIILTGAFGGLNVVSDSPGALVITVVAVMAKVVCGYISMRFDTATDRDLAEGEPELSRSIRHAI